MGGKIYNLTADVVNGTVTRNNNDLSTAQVTVRNRFRKYIRDEASGTNTKKQIFQPMDLITIWLQRIPGKPIQVFTGYLDSCPYYQGLPGNCTFTASCTLKGLAYKWFDPGLATFTNFIDSETGWIYNPNTGEGQNPAYETQFEAVGGSNFTGTGAQAVINDGGFAKLLHDFLRQAAFVPEDQILISDLPPTLPQIAAQLWTNINTDANTALEQLGTQLSQIMGINYTPPTSSASTTLPPTTLNQINQLINANDTNGNKVDNLVLIFAALLLTNFNIKYNVSQSQNPNNWGYGLFALRTQVNFAGQNPLPTPLDSSGTSLLNLTGTTIDGKTINQVLDLSTSVALMTTRLVQAGIPSSQDDIKSLVPWIQKAVGYAINPKQDSLTTLYQLAQTYAGVGLPATPTSTPGNSLSPATISWSDPSVQSDMDAQELQTFKASYQNSDPWLAWAFLQAKNISLDLKLNTVPNQSKNQLVLSYGQTGINAANNPLITFFNTLKGNTSIDNVFINTVSTSGSGQLMQSLNKGTVSSITLASTNLPQNSVLVNWPTSPQPTAASTTSTSTTASSTTDPTGTDNENGISFETLATFSANAAFAANFTFPSNYLESNALTGDRALMNDTSCLEGAQQFAQASMRNLMSLPDGRYLAYYPDYFGAHRGPYWNIRDIEILNLGIQLNDESLATHVYVVGDTFAGDGTIDLFDEVSTRGVATITQEFMLQSFIENYRVDPTTGLPIKESFGELLTDARSFLNHYGARPYSEQNPIIRNAFFEFLMAWQKFMQLWASQFATDCEFTFQPEIMAGGIIGFPDHGLQMFVESVTHNFDYTAGFSTTAVLSSPASLNSTQGRDNKYKPGFALAGTINTVGASG